VRDEKDNRYDTRFTPCMTKACPRALNPPEACPRCDKFDAACASFNAYLMQQPDVVCTYSDRRFHSRDKYCKPVTLATEAKWADVSVFGALRHLTDPRDPASCAGENEGDRARFINSHTRGQDGTFTNLVCTP
jgi:hypothetical protein